MKQQVGFGGKICDTDVTRVVNNLGRHSYLLLIDPSQGDVAVDQVDFNHRTGFAGEKSRRLGHCQPLDRAAVDGDDHVADDQSPSDAAEPATTVATVSGQDGATRTQGEPAAVTAPMMSPTPGTTPSSLMASAREGGR